MRRKECPKPSLFAKLADKDGYVVRMAYWQHLIDIRAKEPSEPLRFEMLLLAYNRAREEFGLPEVSEEALGPL
jgi:hypothetical protein